MAWSVITYTGDGSTTEFSIPFDYLDKDHLSVYVNSILQTAGAGNDYTVNTSTNKVVFTTAPANTLSVKIQRVTPRDEDNRTVIFSDGSEQKASSLNNAILHNMFLIQELIDQLADDVGIDPEYDLTTKADVGGGNLSTANKTSWRSTLNVIQKNEAGARPWDIKIKTASHTLDQTDRLLLADMANSTADVAFTFPDGLVSGTIVMIRNISAHGSNQLNLVAGSGVSLEHAGTNQLTAAGEGKEWIFNDSDKTWYIVRHFSGT